MDSNPATDIPDLSQGTFFITGGNTLTKNARAFYPFLKTV